MVKIQMKARTRRDLTILTCDNGECFVIACDSCGAIGEKDGDMLKIPARISAKLTARVALTEVMCSGASPVAVINGAACEMEPTGRETILGIRDELESAGIADIALTGSTEENFPTVMTAFAITVIGAADDGALRFGRPVEGDAFVLLGKPRVGAEVDINGAGFYTEIRRMLQLPEVREIVPAGSKGVAYEAETLAVLNGMAFYPYATADPACLRASAGPATCLLVLCAAPSAGRVLDIYPDGVIIGELR